MSRAKALKIRIEGRYGPPVMVMAELGAELRWSSVDAPPVNTEPAAARIVKALRSADEPMTADGLADATGISKRTVQNTLTSLNTEGKVVRSGTGSKTEPYRYSVVGTSEEQGANRVAADPHETDARTEHAGDTDSEAEGIIHPDGLPTTPDRDDPSQSAFW